MTDDEPLCHYAGFCGTSITNVWKLIRETSDPDVRERLKRMVSLCPSGRLRYADPDGTDGEAALSAEVAAVSGGPLYVRGPILIEAPMLPGGRHSAVVRFVAAVNRRTNISAMAPT